MRLPYMITAACKAVYFVWKVKPTSLRLAQVIRQGKFDLVYNNSLLNPYGALAARLAGVPWSGPCTIWQESGPTLWDYPPGRACWPDRIIVVSKPLRGFFRARGKKKIRVVYNGVDTVSLIRG